MTFGIRELNTAKRKMMSDDEADGWKTSPSVLLKSRDFPWGPSQLLALPGVISYGLEHWNGVSERPEFLQLLQLVYIHHRSVIPPALLVSTVQWTHDSLLVLKASPSGVSEEVGLLKTLATALYENGPLLDASLHSLLLALFQSKLSSKTSPDTHYATLLCLHNLVLKTTGQKYASLHQSVLDIVLSYLQLSSATFSTPTETRNLIRAWKLVPVLLTESKGGFLQKAFPLVESILRLIKQHLFAIPMEQLVANSSGLDSFGDIQAVSPPHSSFIPLIESPNPEASLASRRTAFVKLQYQVLLCLSSMAKNCPKQVYPNWSLFIPDAPDSSQESLFSIQERHPMMELRLATGETLSALLDQSKQYLSMAEDLSRVQAFSFTSLSQRLASFIHSLHTHFLVCLKTEAHPAVLAQNVKCLTKLLRNCTYDRLSGTYREDGFAAIFALFKNSDSIVIVACLDCLVALLDAGLKQGPAKDDLLAELVASILPATYSAIRIAGFEALSALIRADWLSLSQLWECVSIPLNDSVVDSEPAIQESALKCVLEYAAKMSAADASFTESEESIVHPPSTEAQDWWSQNLELVHERVSDPTAAVRSLALDTLSHIPSSVLATLPNRQRISILTLALGMQQDLEPSVRAAACGVLGVFVGYESIRDDSHFVMDIASQIPSLVKDDSLAVRMRASWVLANLCQALVTLDSVTPTQLDLDIIQSLVEAGLFAAKDKDRCRPNGVRALGNIFQILPDQWIQRETEHWVKEIVGAILKNVDAGQVKSRWNACHALANLLHCSSFPIGQASYTPSVFKSLTNVIHTSKNFKVRIAAASALGEMKSLGQFGGDKAEQRQTLKLVVTSLQDALAKTDDLVDSNFGEFKYQDQLKEQLTLTLVKLQSLDPSSPSSNGTLDKL